MNLKVKSIVQILPPGISLLLAFSVYAQSISEVNIQQIQEFHPSWPSIPPVNQPSFSYQEVNIAELLAGASESLNYLPVDHLIVGNTKGYQVIGPDGEVFYVDNIEKPKCAVVAQYIESSDGDLDIGSSPTIVSNVYIEQIDFQNCY